jgi:hypothetical protein
MADTEQTKVCPLCAETIKVAAKVCPHCRYWQKRWSLQNPQTMQSVGAVLTAVLIFGGIACVGYFFDYLAGPKRDFAQYQNQIMVVNSETSFRIANSNLTVSVVGVVTNQSVFGWKDIGIEAQLFDGNGKMIDVIQAEGGYRELTVLAHSEASFKIEGKATRNEQEYKSTKVFVRTAKDINAMFDY